MSMESVMPSNYLIIYNPFFLLPSAFSSLRAFSNESALHIGWPKYWSFSFSITPSSEWSRLISFRIDWFAFLAVQGTLKRLPQNNNLKASIPFFIWSNSSHLCGPLEKGMANHFSILALRTPWTLWKGKMIGYWKRNSPRSVGAQYATGDQWRNNFRKNEGMEKSKKNTQLWMWLVIEARSNAVKSNIA